MASTTITGTTGSTRTPGPKSATGPYGASSLSPGKTPGTTDTLGPGNGLGRANRPGSSNVPGTPNVPGSTFGTGTSQVGSRPTLKVIVGAQDAGSLEAYARLYVIERRVSAQAVALSRVPRHMPVPPAVLALLATVPHELEGVTLPPHCKPRVAVLIERLQTMIDDLSSRQRVLAGRIATVRSARRPQRSPQLVDYSS